MIQRIQSIYLVLAAVAGVILFLMPVYSLVPGETATDTATYLVSIREVNSLIDNVATFQLRFWPLIVLNTVVIALTLVTIFQYKDRKKQMKICRFTFLLVLLLIALTAFDTGELRKSIGAGHILNFQWASAMFILQLLFLQLANRAIKKDEALVRSADRLR